MTKFQTNTRHAYTEQVEQEVFHWHDAETTISDESAVAIAGWYSGPGESAFTLLAQTGKGDTGELGDAIVTEIQNAQGSVDRYTLEALSAWVTAQAG